MKQVRQGDILFIQSETTLTESAPVLDGVIARGTATGHTHRVRPSDQSRLVKSGEVLFVLAESLAWIDHEEHSTVTLSPGTWEIRRQREETPEGFRQVED